MSQPAQRAVFNIGELLLLVNAHLHPKYGARLARLNKMIFSLVMPLLWKRVRNVCHLFMLIGSEAQENNEKMQPQPDFTRFEIYAPWINSICVDENPRFTTEMRILYQRSLSHTLLPNLQHIVCSSIEDVSVILAFLSPSLLTLKQAQIGQVGVHLSVPSMSVLLHRLPQNCPKLRSLAVIPDYSSNLPYPKLLSEYGSDKNKLECEDLLKGGSKFTLATTFNLTHLSTSLEFLDYFCFNAIAASPSIRALELLCTAKSTIPDLTCLDFSSIKHLTLNGYDTFNVFSTIWGQSTLVGRLTSVTLVPGGRSMEQSSNVEDTARVLPMLAKQSPNINSFRMYFGRPGMSGMPISLLDLLQRLPLGTLHLRDVRFIGHPIIPVRLGDMFSKVTELGINGHRVTYAMLRTFQTHMPQLQMLQVEIIMDSISTELDVSLEDIPYGRGSSFRSLVSAFIEHPSGNLGFRRYTHHKLMITLRYLFSLWPHVQLINQSHIRSMEDCPSPIIGLINNYLAALAWCNANPNMKYENMKSLTREAWYNSIASECTVTNRNYGP